ncbi:MAG: hypothetical protein AABX93_03205 [Nanoarchaeota archaeon]
MNEFRERLRKALCPDDTLDDAVGVLGKLVRLENERSRWPIHPAMINGYPEHQLVDRMSEGGLVKREVDSGSYYRDCFLYSILPKGRELYEQLMREANLNAQHKLVEEDRNRLRSLV